MYTVYTVHSNNNRYVWYIVCMHCAAHFHPFEHDHTIKQGVSELYYCHCLRFWLNGKSICVDSTHSYTHSHTHTRLSRGRQPIGGKNPILKVNKKWKIMGNGISDIEMNQKLCNHCSWCGNDSGDVGGGGGGKVIFIWWGANHTRTISRHTCIQTHTRSMCTETLYIC